MNKKEQILLGAHMSIEKGLAQSVLDGNLIGCTCIQIFTKNNRSWNFSFPTENTIAAFKKAQLKTNISCIVAHASYLINLASPNNEIYQKSIIGLINEITISHALEIPLIVLHPGSFTTSSLKEGIQKIALGINTVLEKTSFFKGKILLETMAGQGSSIGKNFNELHNIYAEINDKKKIGFCLDTCHIFAAGNKIETKKEYEHLWEKFDKTLGLKTLGAIHVNNSLTECGSRKDRHANIFEGKINNLFFKLLMQDHSFYKIPKIIETPKKNKSLEEHKKNLVFLKNFI